MKKNKFYKLADFIILKKKFFLVLFFILCSISVYTMSLTNVQDDLLYYLDDDSLTKTGISVFDSNFSDSNMTANMMLDDITLDEAFLVYESLSLNDGVLHVDFSENLYISDSALFKITFDTTDSVLAKSIMDEILDDVQNDVYVDSSLYKGDIDELNNDMVVILVIVIFLILLIVTFTSKSFAEIPILLIVFFASALINLGTNFFFSDISFISNAVAVILQLALAIDYALIFLHRYTEKREKLDSESACSVSLSESIAEILSSSLTTIFSLIALSFMSYNLGLDLAKVLIKSIIISLFAVFTLMPALICVFADKLEKTKHRNYVPNILGFGSIVLKIRYFILPIFLIITILSAYLSYQTNYTFYEDGASALVKSEILKIEEVFGKNNSVVLLVPNEDVSLQHGLIEELSDFKKISSITSFYSMPLFDGITFLSEISSLEASVLLNLDEEMVSLLFYQYAVVAGEIDTYLENPVYYKISVLNLLYFLNDSLDSLDPETALVVSSLYNNMQALSSSLESNNYSAIVLNLDLDIEGKQTFALVEDIISVTNEHYDDSYFIGNSINSYELSSLFKLDNSLINCLSALFILIILLFTFKSFFISICMIMVIQTAIFLNFSFPYIQDVSLYFIGYLIVCAIQMGANIDYAIVITNRFMINNKTLDAKTSATRAINEAFPTIITSGSILAIAGFVLHYTSSNTIIATLGLCIGRGTIISVILVLVVLPQMLYLENKFKNKFKKN